MMTDLINSLEALAEIRQARAALALAQGGA